MIEQRKVSVIRLSLAAWAVLGLVSAQAALGQSIKGPATAGVNQEVRLVADGLDTPDVDKAQEWAAKIKLATSAPDASSVFVDPELTLGLGVGGMKLKIYFTADKPGVYVIVLDDNNSGKLLLHRITVSGDVPPAPVPPGPSPGPTPGPTPTPTPTPALSTFSVMIIEETAERSSLPRSQAAAMASLGVRMYFNQKNAVWRMWDDDYTDQQIGGESQEIQQLYKRAVADSKGRRPWIVVGSKAGSESVELPADEAALLTLLKKWGG